MLLQVLRYVIDQRIAAGALPSDVDRTVKVITPELSVRDLQKAAAALQSTAAGLLALQQASVVDERTMAQVAATVIAQLGVDLDPAELLDRTRRQSAGSR